MHQLVIHLFFCLSNTCFPEHLLCVWPCSWHQGHMKKNNERKGKRPLVFMEFKKHKPAKNFSSMLEPGDGYVEISPLFSCGHSKSLHKALLKKRKTIIMPFIWSIYSSRQIHDPKWDQEVEASKPVNKTKGCLTFKELSLTMVDFPIRWVRTVKTEKLGDGVGGAGYSTDQHSLPAQ